MANIEKRTLGFLGADYQYRLVNAFIEDGKFFKDTYSVIEQNAFTEPCLRSIVGVMKDYYSAHGSVPSYDLINIKLREKVIHNDDDKQYYDETIDKLKHTTCEGRIEIENLGLEFFKQQETIRCSNELLGAVAVGANMEEVSKYVNELQDVLSIRRHEDSITSPFESMEDDLLKENSVYVPTGISKIDEALGGGLEKGKIGLIIGPTGFGKTSMTTCMAANAATYLCEANNYEGYKILQIIFEDTQRDIHRKYFGKVSGIESADINKDEATTEKVREILNNSKDREYINNNVRIVRFPTGEKSATDIKNFIVKIINEGFNPDLVIIDYFECLAPESGTSKLDITEREGRTSRKIENMAAELNIAIWAATQGNRDSIASEIVTTDKIGGSIKKGQIFQIILSIARTPDQKKENKATISLLKNRGGRDTINLQGVYFNNGTCTIDCSDIVDFDDVLEYNEFATEKEKEIQREMIRETRQPYKFHEG